ncbi:transmembrane protein 26-like [Mya arenaria]|uniref:transmembrane protein 26-like n=1 Tax=Mya arenaria TaxID=6604 RepID=UPI0022DFAD5E|nr:transmembrane protein 26-like [Mya arenaria]
MSDGESNEPECIPVVVKVVFLRAVMILHIILSTWRVVIVMQNSAYWVLVLLCVFVLIEDGFEILKYYVKTSKCNGPSKKNKRAKSTVGNNYTTSKPKWRSALIVYLVCMVPIVWLLTFHLQSSTSTTTSSGQTNTTVTTTTQTSIILGIQNLEDKTWILVVIQSTMYILLVTRCIYDGTSDDCKLSENLSGFLGTASDIMDLFSLFDEDDILQNQPLTVLILLAWTLSFIQFAPILENWENLVEIDNTYNLMSICLQDGPFLILRVSIMVSLKKAKSSLVFFVIKNIVTLILVAYKMMAQAEKPQQPSKNNVHIIAASKVRR